MKYAFIKIINLLSILLVMYGLMLGYFYMSDSRFKQDQALRKYNQGIYQNADSYVQYLFFSENELKESRNKRFKKIIENYNSINNSRSKEFLKRKATLSDTLGKDRFLILDNVIKQLDKMILGQLSYPSKSLSWDLYFFEQSQIFEYLEKLQSPVLDNDFLRNRNGPN